MEQFWTILDDAGEVLCPCYTTDGAHPRERGWPWVDGQHRATPIATRPDPAADEWLGDHWGKSLVFARSQRWEEVKAARDAAQDNGCQTPLGRVDTSKDSRGLISGSVQMAMLAQASGQEFEVGWTMADNETVLHDAVEMLALGMAVGQHVADCHAVALTKRAALDAALDIAGIEAIDPSEGWPL